MVKTTKITALGLAAVLAFGPALVELDNVMDVHTDNLPGHSQHSTLSVIPVEHEHGDSDDHHPEDGGGCHHATHCCSQHGSGTLAIETLLGLNDGISQIYRPKSRYVNADLQSKRIFHPPLA